MEPASKNFRGDIAFAERRKLNHVTRTVKTLSPKREDEGNKRIRQAIDPRWDPYSGEITSSDKGKPQSVKPKTFGISSRQVNNQKGNNGDLKSPTPVVERIRKLNSGISVDTLETRDSTHVESIPVINPEIFAEEYSSHPEQEIQSKTRTNLTSNDSNSSMGKELLEHSETKSKASALSDDIRTTNITSKPINKIYEVGANKYSNVGTGLKNEKISGLSSDHVFEEVTKKEKELSSIEIHPSNGPDMTNHLLTSETKSQKKPIQPHRPINFENTDRTDRADQVHGPNSLSIITSTDAQQSSDHNWDKNLNKSELVAQPESIVINRVRPKEISPNLHQIARKAIPLGSPIFISMSIPPNTDAKDRHLFTKSLPQTPAENSSNDLVAALQAHLDSLAHRRRNIAQSIRQMTELMPRDNLLITDEVRLKREHEKRKVAMLREEEAEIKREEHEVGLRLHRAWKRTESGAVYEPTSLWVRRVTGVGKNWCWPHQDLPVC